MATGTKVENFYASFGADFRELLAEYKKAERETGRFRAGMKRELEDAQGVINRFASQARSAFLGLAGAFGLTRITQFARETLRWADEMKALADRLGLTAESLQELQFAGREVNITTQEMGKGLSEFALKLAEAASGKGRGVEAFRQMGLSIRDAKGEAKSFDALLDEFADKIKEFDRPSQLALAKTFFGDEGALKFLDLLGQGSEKMRALREEGRRTGHVLKNELFDQGEKLNKDVERLEHKIGTDLKQAVLDFAPAWKVALEAVVEVQMAVDKLLSSIRIGSFRIGKAVSPVERRAEIERDIADAERKLSTAEGSKPDKFGTATSRGREEAAKLRQDLTRLRGELEEAKKQAPLSAEVDKAVTEAQAAARRRQERETAPEQGKRKVDLSGTGTAQAETFRKFMEDLRTETAKATAALDPYKAALAEVEGKLAKMNATTAQGKQAKAEFDKAWDAKGAKALAEFGAESDHLAKLAAAEAAGRRDLVAVLETEFALRQRFGDKVVKDNQAQIEEQARLRLKIEDARANTRALQDELRGGVGDALRDLTSAMLQFGNTSETVWRRLGNTAVNILNRIADKLIELSVINPLLNLLPGTQKLPTLDILSVLGLGSRGAGTPSLSSIGAAFPDLTFGFAKGGSFTVGGKGGTDTTPIGFMATPGERVTVETPAQTRRRGGIGDGGGITYIDARGADQAAFARLEQVVRAQGSELRRWQAGEGVRVRGHMVDVRREGGAVSGLYGG